MQIFPSKCDQVCVSIVCVCLGDSYCSLFVCVSFSFFCVCVFFDILTGQNFCANRKFLFCSKGVLSKSRNQKKKKLRLRSSLHIISREKLVGEN